MVQEIFRNLFYISTAEYREGVTSKRYEVIKSVVGDSEKIKELFVVKEKSNYYLLAQFSQGLVGFKLSDIKMFTDVGDSIKDREYMFNIWRKKLYTCYSYKSWDILNYMLNVEATKS